MKKTITAIVITSVLVGCGEDKTPEQIKFEQEKELLLMQQRHEQEMKRLEVKQVAAENQVSHTYVENEYETEYNGGYNNAIREEQVEPTSTSTASTDSGFSGGEMLLAGAAGIAAGYMVGELLNNGMKSYTDETGKTHYVDKNGKPVSEQDYKDYKKKNPKTTKFKDKVSNFKTKAAPKVNSFKEKAKYQARKTKVLAKKAAKKAKRKLKKGKR